MKDKGNKTYYAVSTEPYGIPGDCMIYDTEKEARRDYPTDLELGEGAVLYVAKVTVGPRTKLQIQKKVATKLVELELSEDDER